MSEENRVRAFLENGAPPQTPAKPASQTPVKVVLNQEAPDELKIIREELIKMRYILDDVRNGRIKSPEPSGEITDKKHEEIKSASNNCDESEVIEILSKIAMIREDILKLVDELKTKKNVLKKDNMIFSLESYGIDLENLLLDHQVSISPYVSDDFDVKCQQISSVIETDDPSKQGKIAESLGDYYVRDGTVLCKSRVQVYKYVKKCPKNTYDKAPQDDLNE